MFFVFRFNTIIFIQQILIQFLLKNQVKSSYNSFILLGSLVVEKSQYWPSTENDENSFYSIKNVYTQKQDDQIVVRDLFVVDVQTGDIRTKRKINYTLDCANNCFCIVNILVSIFFELTF